MARRTRRDFDSADDDPLESDQIASAEPALVRCPYCGKTTSEFADVCHACGSFIFADDERRLSNGWRTVSMVVLIFVTAAAFAGYLFVGH